MTTATSLEQRTVEPIVLENLALDGEAVRGNDGEYLIKTQQGWMEHLAGSGTRLPTLPEYFAFIHHLQTENHPASEGLLQDLRESAICVGTQFGYHNNNNAITHFGDGNPFVIPCIIPKESGYLDDLVEVDAWRKVLHRALQYANAGEAVEVLHKFWQYANAGEAVEVLHKFSGKRPFIWTLSAESRKLVRASPARAVWLGGCTDRFNLSCGLDPIYGSGRARRVRKKSSNDLISAQECDTSSHSLRRLERCEAPRAENGSAYRTPAKTQEEVREEKIREELLRFEKYVSPPDQDLYNKEVQQALKNIKGLFYHGK